MNPTTLEAAGTFCWNNARLLERQRYRFLFQGGSREPALAALRAYQNADGGFGNALEPDIRCPESQPIDQELGITVLDEIGFEPEIATRVCDFLQTITTEEGGVPFVLPSVRDYPHAPWWDTEPNPPAAINPTASIAGLLLKNGFRHPWVEQATEFCWRKIAEIQTEEVHDLLSVLNFLQYAPDRERAQSEFTRFIGAIRAGTAVDPHATGYVKKPLDWAPTPESLCRSLFSDSVIAAHLEALAAQQQSDGGWPIAWPPVSPACELEYRGWVTIGALKTLRAYGVLNSAQGVTPLTPA